MSDLADALEQLGAIHKEILSRKKVVAAKFALENLSATERNALLILFCRHCGEGLCEGEPTCGCWDTD